ncbi:MAG: prolyl oligopeptidase family serine peptidase [Muribaculaceae bacterium]|nr:prolyl oligopeptidase family serine peptidase [Muribaculaceae bacterium]
MKNFFPLCAGLAILATTGSCGKGNPNPHIDYPAAPQDSTTYDAFGVTVDDRFRPLENDTAAATTEWVEAENRITNDYLSRIPFREGVRKRLTSLNEYTKNGLPWKGNDGKIYYYRNDGLSPQAVLYRASDAEGTDEEVFLDPNSLSEDGTVALTGVYQSKDGSKTAYTVSRSGSDWTEIYVMDTASGKLLEDHIEWAKFTGAAWHGDGFYYSAYPKPADGKELSAANEYHSVYYHRLGTPQSEDKVVYEDRNAPLHFHSADVSDDESMMFISIGGQGNGNALLAKDLRNPNSKWVTIEPSQDYDMEVVDAFDGNIYVYTGVDAPKYRFVKLQLDKPGRENWTEILPESENVLSSVNFADGKIIAKYSKDASDHAYLYSESGELIREIEFPTYGSSSFSTRRESPEVFYAFSSFVYPSSRYSYDLSSGESTELKDDAHSSAKVNPEDYVTEQVFYPSKDGTKIPMFLTYKKGLKRDGSNPVYLYGYGGFNVSLPPGFSANRLFWLENGGIYAQTNLRGGGEYGHEWHEAGTKMQKQNVFDDFIAAGEYLINEGWTRPDLLAIEGGSNGGLLVGAVVNQRPELFGVAIPRVGVMDMMRYHLFTIGWNWAHDYGTADDSPEMAHYLLGYSPLHTIQSGPDVRYPAIMVTTADHDDRVVPAHSFKYAAALQAAETGPRPKLIRIDSKAGHGAGKPVGKVIDEYTDIYSFIFYNMGLEPVTAKEAEK